MAVVLEWYGNQLMTKAEAATERGLTKLAGKIAQHSRDLMHETKHGKKYRSLPQTTSAPYEAPAVQTARLQNSVQIDDSERMIRKIGTNLDYGLYLEVGTSKMTERPYLRPALFKFTGRAGEELFESLLK